jgi:hypothetical protein
MVGARDRMAYASLPFTALTFGALPYRPQPHSADDALRPEQPAAEMGYLTDSRGHGVTDNDEVVVAIQRQRVRIKRPLCHPRRLAHQFLSKGARQSEEAGRQAYSAQKAPGRLGGGEGLIKGELRSAVFYDRLRSCTETADLDLALLDRVDFHHADSCPSARAGQDRGIRSLRQRYEDP